MAIDRKKKKKEQNKMMMYLAGIVYLFVLFYSLHVGTVMTITHETNIFNAFYNIVCIFPDFYIIVRYTFVYFHSHSLF